MNFEESGLPDPPPPEENPRYIPNRVSRNKIIFIIGMSLTVLFVIIILSTTLIYISTKKPRLTTSSVNSTTLTTQIPDTESPGELSTLVPLRSADIPDNATWVQNGITVAGGHGLGNGFYQLYFPNGLFVDDNETVFIADCANNRIVEWKDGVTSGQVVAGGNGQLNRTEQIILPKDVILDKENDSLIICDPGNRRVMRWSRLDGTSGQTIISDVDCWGLTMDYNRSLYVADYENNDVRRWRVGEDYGTVVAAGNGKGYLLDQLNGPTYIFVDRDDTVYVSDSENHRVMKWVEGAKAGIIVAGGQGNGTSLTQLYYPGGVIVDQLGTVYVADIHNNRVMRWPKGATQGNVIVGGDGGGEHMNQLNYPRGLSFDRHGNLYVADYNNNRVQKFNINRN